MSGGDKRRDGLAWRVDVAKRVLRWFSLRSVSPPDPNVAGRRGVAGAEPEENALERTARALSEFVIRVALLPLTALMTSPGDLIRVGRSGSYKPLPSPFLLALVTGVLVSGVTSALLTPEVLQSRQTKALVSSVAKFYDDMDGLESIVYAIPYLAFLWGLAGAISLLMWRGLRNAHAVFVGLSLSLGAIIEVATLRIVVGLLVTPPKLRAKAGFAFDFSSIDMPVLVGLVVFATILGWKLVRFVFLLQGQSKAPWLGAVAAAALAFLAVVSTGLASVLATHWIVLGFR